MLKTIKKSFLAVVLTFAALFTLASCNIFGGAGGGTTPTDPTADAQAALNEFTAQVTFANTDAVTTSFNLAIAGKKSGYTIPITWTSSNKDVIDVVDLMENGAPSTYYKQAKVTRPAFDKEDATVTLTADFSLTYTKADGTSATLKAQKTYTFVVLKETSEIATGNLASIKEAAGKFYFEENGVAAGTSSSSELAYPVEFEATVTAVLGAEGAGQFTVSDGSAGIFVYGNKTSVKVGDKVKVKGDITVYYGTLQVGNNIEVTVLGTSTDVIEFKPSTPGAINAMSTADGMFGGQTLKVAGKLLYGKYNNGSNDSFWLEDAQTGSQVELYYKSFTTAENEAMQAYAGKYVEIDAVTYDTYSKSAPNDHRIFVIPSSIKEATAPEVTDADKLAAAVNKVKAVSLAALYVDGQEFAFPTVDAGEGVEITWAMDPATLLVDGKLVIAEAGTAKLIATVKVADLSETVELTINVAKEAKEEPSVTEKTVAELIALTTEMDAKYTVTGKVVKWGKALDSTDTAPTMYGNFILEDAEGKQIVVYGTTATASALVFDSTTGKYTYTNPKDFLTNALTSTIAIGDTVELVVVRTSYNSNPQLNAIVTKVTKAEGGETPEQPEQPGENSTITLDFGVNASTWLGAKEAASDTERTFTVDGVTFAFAQMYGSGYNGSNFGMFVKSTTSYLYNTTAIPGKILSIEFVVPSGASGSAKYYADLFNEAKSGSITSTNTMTGTGTLKVTATEENGYSFFNITNDSTTTKNGQIQKIIITYIPSEPVEPEQPTHTCVPCEECGKCTAADCDKAETEKCPGHTTEPEQPTYLTVAQVKASATDTEVLAKGLVAAVYNRGFVLYDGTESILVYTNATVTVVVGDYVEVSGKKGAYPNDSTCHQIGSPEYKKLDETATFTLPAATKWTSVEVDAAWAEVVAGTYNFVGPYVEMELEVTVSGNYTNAKIEGSSVNLSISYPTITFESAKYTVKALPISYSLSSGSPKYFNFIVVEAEKVVEEPTHTCVPCEECGKCTAADCDKAETEKCPGHTTEPEQPTHTCVPCEECGKCTAADCDKAETEKCPGHTTEPEQPTHTCVPCETCQKCTAADCDKAETEKCPGHTTEPEQPTPSEPVTVTLTVKEAAAANGWGSSANNLKNPYAIDENISISVAGGNNSGKFYTDHLRIYATDSPAGSITLTAKEGYKIKSVSFKLKTGTYAFLQLDGVTVVNEQVVELDASTVTFKTVKNGSDGKQVQLFAVTVTYVAE